MTDADQNLCDRCHERPAICHICNGLTGEITDLCEPCYQAGASSEELALVQHFSDVMQNGKCQFCGDPAAGGCSSGGTGGGNMSILGERHSLWCEPCCRDLNEFASMPENAVTADFPFDDEAAQEQLMKEFAERERRQVEFMKQKVAQRRRGT